MVVASRAAPRLPRYVLERARRAPVPGSGVVAGSTPVVYLGDPARARVATLGINPPHRQFLDASGRLLTGDRRRLATLDSLGVADPSHLTIQHAAAIVADCASYFERHPYHWFETLDEVIRSGLGASYFAGTACHLDLVQWATTTSWAGLTPVMQADLLRADIGFLRRLLDGARSPGPTPAPSGGPAARSRPRPGTPTAGVYTGERGGLRFVGWTCNVQGHAGAAAHAPRLAELAAELAGGPALASAATAG